VSICDFLLSADVCVASAQTALERLQAALDFPSPVPGAYARYDEGGWDVIFALVNKPLAAAPTRLEIIAPLDPPDARAPRAGRRIYDAQAPRLWRTHATVVATPDLPALVERVRAAGARHWLQPAGKEVGFDRLWIGTAQGDTADYDGAVDSGLRLEFVPSSAAALPPEAFRRPADRPQRGDAGLRRIRYRSFLVDDLSQTLRRLEAVLGWTPDGPVREEPSRGYRYAEMSLNHSHGAALRVAETFDPDLPVGRDYVTQGPGAYAITIGAFDLQAMAAALTERGAPFHWVPAGRYEPEAIVLDVSLGAPILLVPDQPLR